MMASNIYYGPFTAGQQQLHNLSLIHLHATQMLSLRDVGELKSYRCPDDNIKHVMVAVAKMMGEETNSWHNALRLFLEPHKLLRRILEFDKDTISSKTMQKFENYCRAHAILSTRDCPRLVKSSRAVHSMYVLVTSLFAYRCELKSFQKMEEARLRPPDQYWLRHLHTEFGQQCHASVITVFLCNSQCLIGLPYELWLEIFSCWPRKFFVATRSWRAASENRLSSNHGLTQL